MKHAIPIREYGSALFGAALLLFGALGPVIPWKGGNPPPTWTLVVVGVSGALVVIHALLGHRVEVDHAAAVVRVFHRTPFFTMRLDHTLPIASIDRVGVTTHTKKQKQTFSAEIVTTDEQRFRVGGVSSSSPAKIALAQRLERAIKARP